MDAAALAASIRDVANNSTSSASADVIARVRRLFVTDVNISPADREAVVDGVEEAPAGSDHLVRAAHVGRYRR